MLSEDQKLSLLKIEYESLSAGQRMYLQQYMPVFTAFGTTVIAGLGFVLAHKGYEIVYLLIPILVAAISCILISQSHMVAAEGIRVRAIERKVAEMNGQEPVLEWEHRYAPLFVFPRVINVTLGNGKAIKYTNPTCFLVLVIIALCLSIIVYSCVNAWQYLSRQCSYWTAWAYVLLVAVMVVRIAFLGFCFFRLGNADIERTLSPGNGNQSGDTEAAGKQGD
jgi:magnesium-transporting ATPase (P-type)